MASTLLPAPKKYSYNFACDIVDKIFNDGNEWRKASGDNSHPDKVVVKHINSNVTFFYNLENELIAMYDEASGDLWGAWSLGHR